MKEEQKNRISLHVAQNSKPGFGHQHYLIHGECVQFSNPIYTSYNAEFSIEGSRKIWYSQLADRAFTGDFDEIITAEIKLKNGEVYNIHGLSVDSFAEIVQDRIFRVKLMSEAMYTVNNSSQTLENKYGGSINVDELSNLLKGCIEKDDFSALGDILKYARIYDLEEV